MTPPIEGIEIKDFQNAKLVVSKLNEEERELLLEALKTESKETNEKSSEFEETPLKELEKERKTAAIVELEKLGMKTDENVEKINAIKFLDDKILIENTPWAYENMTGKKGTFKKETNKYYYDFSGRKAEAKNQGIVLPEKKDFENTLKALPGEYSEFDLYKGGNILSIILGESRTGHCGSDGYHYNNGKYGYLGSVSGYGKRGSRGFGFEDGMGMLSQQNGNYRFVCRPLVKNS